MARPAVGVMFLETQLDAAMDSPRTQIRFMRELLGTFGNIDLIAKEVHSRSDLEKFLEYSRSDDRIQVVHVVSHGEETRGESALVLTEDEVIDLRHRENRHLFRALHVELLFFSSCRLGQDRALMRKLLEVSAAVAVFSYARDVDDYQAFITESLVYHLAYGYFRGRRSDLSLVEVYEKVKFCLDYLGIDPSRRALADPLLTAEFAGIHPGT
jgi:hypothetical protein